MLTTHILLEYINMILYKILHLSSGEYIVTPQRGSLHWLLSVYVSCHSSSYKLLHDNSVVIEDVIDDIVNDLGYRPALEEFVFIPVEVD